MWNKIKDQLNQCSDRTILQGFNYLIIKNVSSFTRLFFILISCCGFILCGYLILLQIAEYQHQVLITKIDTPNFPLWKFRFPSVTVCNFNVVYKDNTNHLVDVVSSQGIKVENFMDFAKNLSHLIENSGTTYNSTHNEEIYDVLQRNGYNMDQIMTELAPPCKTMVKKCFWRAQEVPCSSIIQTVKTRLGYCCSFNYYGSRKISQHIEDPHNVHFTYLGLSGLAYALRLILDTENEQYVSSIVPAHGFYVLVQDGGDYINQYQKPTSYLLTGEELKISVSPNLYVTTTNVRNLDLDQRKCLYEDERDLEWSAGYSFHTCMNQCQAKAIFEICNCTPFFYPIDNYTRICNLLDVNCLVTNRYKYAYLGVIENSILEDNEEVKEIKGSGKHWSCPCYPQCDTNIFNIQPFRSPAAPVFGYENSNLSILNVYYNDMECIRIEKDVSYTWYTLVAEVGGTFSLCLGASLISFVEWFYFFGKMIYSCGNSIGRGRSS